MVSVNHVSVGLHAASSFLISSFSLNGRHLLLLPTSFPNGFCMSCSRLLGVPWWLSGLRIWCCYCCGSGCCCGRDSIPGLGELPHVRGTAKKKKLLVAKANRLFILTYWWHVAFLKSLWKLSSHNIVLSRFICHLCFLLFCPAHVGVSCLSLAFCYFPWLRPPSNKSSYSQSLSCYIDK